MAPIELTFGFSFLQKGHHLAAKDLGHNLDRQKESLILRRYDPLSSVQLQPTRSHRAMQVGMVSKLPCPGVQHHRDPRCCAQVAGVLTQFQQRFRDCAEQKVIDDSLIAIGNISQTVRQREDHMKVSHG